MKYKVIKPPIKPLDCKTTDELDECQYYFIKRNNFSYIASYAATSSVNVLPISLLHQYTVNVPLKEFIETRIEEGCEVYGFNEVKELLEFVLKENSGATGP